MRKANQQLQKFGGDWEALLRGKVTVIGDPFADMPAPPKQESGMARPAAPHRPRPPPPPPPARPVRAAARCAALPATQPEGQRHHRLPAPISRAQAAARPASNLYAGSCLKCSNHVAERGRLFTERHKLEYLRQMASLLPLLLLRRSPRWLHIREGYRHQHRPRLA